METDTLAAGEASVSFAPIFSSPTGLMAADGRTLREKSTQTGGGERQFPWQVYDNRTLVFKIFSTIKKKKKDNCNMKRKLKKSL